MRNKAKIFICHHPAGLLLYKNFVKIIRQYDKELKIILFKVNHPYFLKFDFAPYKQYFDEIVEFDFIHYEKNFLLGLWKIFNFQKKLKKASNKLLRDFETVDLFLDYSAWLPVNVLLYNLSKLRNVKNIDRITLSGIEQEQTKTDRLKTLFCTLYSLPFKCYKVKVISTLGGQFVNFAYAENTPGTILKIVNPTINFPNDFDGSKENNILPYPILPNGPSNLKKDMVIIFGNESIYSSYPEYFPDYKTYVEKLSAVFKNIENRYSDCKLYYKPHPADGDKIMPGIIRQKYSLFDNAISAETLFDTHQEKIKAVYALSSTSVMLGSFFGVPSYTFYRYLCNKAGIDYFDVFLNQPRLKSKFLFHLSDLSEIGKIDDLERPRPLDLNNIDNKYRQLFKI